MFNHLKKFDWYLSLTALLISGVGLLAIYNIGSLESLFFFKKQLAFLCAGFILMILVSLLDYRALKNHSSILLSLYFLALMLLILVLFCGEIRGASSWFNFGVVHFEPIEFVKLIIILLLAKYFSLRHIEMYHIKHLIISGVYVGLPVAMVLLQPDFGSALVLCGIWFGLIVLAGIKIRHLLALFLVVLILFSLGWVTVLQDYQKQRILTFLNPQEDPYGSGYQISQSLIAVGSGGLSGQQGMQAALEFLPDQYTDFIFAAWAEQGGLLGVSFLVLLFAFLIWRIVKIALESSNNFSRLFAGGMAIMILTQVVINVGMNVALLPITGITLPLVSYGGSSLVSTFLGLGILQGIKARS